MGAVDRVGDFSSPLHPLFTLNCISHRLRDAIFIVVGLISLDGIDADRYRSMVRRDIADTTESCSESF